MRRQSLLAVFAHPDDESIACGGLLARCAEQGVGVTLVSVSRGEDGPQKERLGIEGLREVRTRELEDACRVLGVEELQFLDYPDGCLPWVDAVELTERLTDIIRRVQPDVVVTFGEDGLYWHPDHVAVHEATRDAVFALGTDAPALYYVTMPPGQMQAVLAAAAPRLTASSRRDLLGIEDAAAFGAAAAPPTLVLHTGPFAARKLSALRCHRTQVAGGPFDHLSAAEAETLLGVEHYRRADIGATGPSFIERLDAASLET